MLSKKCTLMPIKCIVEMVFFSPKAFKIKHPFILIKPLSDWNANADQNAHLSFFIWPINFCLDFYRHEIPWNGLHCTMSCARRPDHTRSSDNTLATNQEVIDTNTQ